LNLSQSAGLDQAAGAADDGVEQEQQDQSGVLVEVQDAVVRLLAGGGVLVQPVEHWQQRLEELEAAQLLLADREAFGHGHAAYDAHARPKAQV
jgi:hypothetical protein